ncbi:MAG: SBBP repeat-containing protein [Candidatus Zixiibacteriota bacterium]|nr:MAG: SBBP repeat-containing protein [candidate division Zixibacteria bacterium]
MLKPLRVVFGVLLVVLVVGPAFAQTVDTAWVRRYDGPENLADLSQAIAVDDSGNVYVTGESQSGVEQFYQHDYATIKYLPNGDTAWVRRYNGPGNDLDKAYAMAVDDDGNVYVSGGSVGSGTSRDYATIKYVSDGDTAWVRRYNGPGDGTDDVSALAVDGSGNVYVTGKSWGCSGNYDIVTIEYHPDGAAGWEAIYSGTGSGSDGADAIAVDASGDVCVTGCAVGFGTYQDYVTIRYGSDGGTWRTYDGPADSSDYGHALAIDGSGNVYVTGNSIGSGTSSDYATIKYLANGDTAWVRRYNGPGNGDDGGRAVAVDNSGNVYVTGYSGGSGTGNDWATIKYLANGDTAWVRRYNGPGNGSDLAAAIAIDGSGNVYVTGASTGSGTGYDFTTIKYLANGDSGWVMRYDGPAGGDDASGYLAMDDSGNVYVTGYSEGSGTDYDYCTIKYVQGVTGVKDETGDRERPSQFDLSQNYPNPFNPATKIEFTLAKSGFVTLQIYDTLGRKVRTLVSEELSSGYKSVIWDGKNDDGEDVASGVYFYQLKVGDFSEPKKMLLLK